MASEMRMDAYYYNFRPTGVPEIDRVLSAVACAGKAFHHTEDWNEQVGPRPHLRGESPAEWIQCAADDAAKALVEAMSKRYCGPCDKWVKGKECPLCGADTDAPVKPHRPASPAMQAERTRREGT